MSELPTLKLREVTVRYGPLTALGPVNCTLEPGTSTALIGPNGSGKSTLLRLLSGLLHPSDGGIEPALEPVAMVPQQQHLSNWMPVTVLEVLRMGRYAKKGLLRRFKARDMELLDTAAERLEVTDLLGRQFGELSSGQRQRVIVAQALVRDAEVLLLDEPIAGLDLPSREKILQIVAEEAGRGRIVVVSTHDLEDAAVCDQVILLANRMVAVGSPQEVLTTEYLLKTYGERLLLDPTGTEVALLYDEHGHGHSHDS